VQFKKSFSICVYLFLLLQNLCGQQPKLMLPIGHDGWVEITLFSPDNKYIISSADKELMIWDVASKKLLSKITDHTRQINSISFSPSGKYFITAANDSTAKIWETRTGTLLQSFKDFSGGIKNASFSPDGKSVITRTYSVLKLWDAFSGKIIEDSIGGNLWGSIASAVFSPDGKYILKGGDYNSTLYKSDTRVVVKEFDDNRSPHKNDDIFASFSHDGKWILSAGDYTPKIWNLETGKIVQELKGHDDRIIFAFFSPDDKTILTVSEFFEPPILWNASSGTIIAKLEGHTGSIHSVQFSPDGKKIITASWDRTAKVWDAKTGKLLLSLDEHTGDLYFGSFSPNGKMIVTGAADQTVKIWDAETGYLLGDLKGHTTPLGKSFTSMISDTMYAIHDKKIVAWNTNNGTLSGFLSGHKNWIGCIVRSKDGKFIATGDLYGSLIIWDPTTLLPLLISGKGKASIRSISFTDNNQFVITGSQDSTVRIWDTKTGQLISQIKETNEVNEVKLSSLGDKLITRISSDVARVWDVQSGKFLYELRHSIRYMKSAAFSPDGKYIVTCTGNGLVQIGGQIRLWNSSDGSLISEYTKTDEWGFFEVVFTPDAKYIITNANGDDIWIWDYKKKNLKKRILNQNGGKGIIQQVSFSPDNQYLVSALQERIAEIWKLENSKLIATLNGHTEYVNSALFTLDGKFVITTSGDNSSKKWNSKTGELVCTFIAIDSSDYFTQIPSGYYQCSSNAAKLLHYVTKDLKFVTFEQLDVKYNRPDKVLEAIGNTDTALIKSYRKAWQKRIKKLGIDTTSFRDGYSVPEADFANRDAIEFEQKKGILKLHIKGIDSTYKLDRFNVWVNEAPLFGQRGVNIKRRNSNTLDTTVTIQLSQGENRIETSITNVNGTESYRMPLYVNYTPVVKQKEMTRFIGIGIDKFSESQYNLQYSTKDIRDLAQKLKKKYGDDMLIDTLFNENVTTANVKALKQKLLQTTENDKVIVSYSGHGMLSKDYDYYLSTYSVNFTKPEENGLPYDELENLLDSIPARKKLLLIDACHSGEVDKEEGIAQNRTADSLGLKKGIIIDQPQAQQQHVGLKNSFELMQSLFVNVGKSTGATIISAAAGNQFALERGDLKNGVFTYSILEAMNKYPTIKISELKKIVGERVEQLTNGLQKPTSRNETIAVDWSLW
jgi:WD40 repeat protein